jgi:hypothetical protein
MQKKLFLLPFLGLFFLTGCNAPIPLAIAGGSGIYYTRPEKEPDANTTDGMPPHESWCYSTLGEVVECFTQPQDTIPSRLVNVDPANRYPMSTKAYREQVTQSQLAQHPRPSMQENTGLSSPPIQSTTMTPIPLVKQQKAIPAPKATTPHKAKKTKKKTHKKIAKPAEKKPSTSVDPCPPCTPKQEPLNGISP